MAQLAQKQVRISEEDWDRLKLQAEKRRMAVSHLVRLILLSYLDEVDGVGVGADTAEGANMGPGERALVVAPDGTDTPESVDRKMRKIGKIVGSAVKRMGV